MSYQLADLSAWGIESHMLRPGPWEQRLLVAYAHPDDESFGNAGSLAYYAKRGVGVHYVCGTNGECGGVKPELLNGYNEIANLRRAELNSAAHALDMASYHLLNYRDSGMQGSPDNQHPRALAAADLQDVTGRIVAVIRATKPQVVITFNPYGGYGHPDHIAMHHATLAAWHAAANPASYPEQLEQGLELWQPRKLYYSTFAGRVLTLMVKMLPLFGVDPRKAGENKDVDFTRALAETTPIHTSIDCRNESDSIMQAWLSHRSQLGSIELIQKLPKALRRLYTNADHFTRVYPEMPLGAPIERDLFDNIAPKAVV